MSEEVAATKIQSLLRGHLVRKLTKRDASGELIFIAMRPAPRDAAQDPVAKAAKVRGGTGKEKARQGRHRDIWVSLPMAGIYGQDPVAKAAKVGAGRQGWDEGLRRGRARPICPYLLSTPRASLRGRFAVRAC